MRWQRFKLLWSFNLVVGLWRTCLLLPPAATWSRVRHFQHFGHQSGRSRAEPLGTASLNAQALAKIHDDNKTTELASWFTEQALRCDAHRVAHRAGSQRTHHLLPIFGVGSVRFPVGRERCILSNLRALHQDLHMGCLYLLSLGEALRCDGPCSCAFPHKSMARFLFRLFHYIWVLDSGNAPQQRHSRMVVSVRDGTSSAGFSSSSSVIRNLPAVLCSIRASYGADMRPHGLRGIIATACCGILVGLRSGFGFTLPCDILISWSWRYCRCDYHDGSWCTAFFIAYVDSVTTKNESTSGTSRAEASWWQWLMRSPCCSWCLRRLGVHQVVLAASFVL